MGDDKLGCGSISAILFSKPDSQFSEASGNSAIDKGPAL